MSQQSPSEFLVEVVIKRPTTMPNSQWDDLVAAERIAARRLTAEGALVRIWRIPGQTGNVGIWSTADATALHEVLCSLPLFPYMEIDVRPLARHPAESE